MKYARRQYRRIFFTVVVCAFVAGICLRMQSANSMTICIAGSRTTCREVKSVGNGNTTFTPPNNLVRNKCRVTNISTSGLNPPGGFGVKYGAHGYLLAVDLCQQATGSFLAFSQLSKIASLFNLSIVEPYVRGTRINGVPRFENELTPKEAVPLGTFYDMISLQNTLKSCYYTNQLVSFETMMTKASRNVIFVCFIPNKRGYNFGPKKIMEIGLHDGDPYDMYFFKRLNMWVSLISKDVVTPFQLSRIIVVDAQTSRPLCLSNITETLSSIIREEVRRNGSATVIFSEWRGIHTEGSKYFYYIPDFPSCNMYNVRHSEAVIKATKLFAQSLSQIHPVIGVHIRGERLLMTSAGSSYHMDCLRQLNKTLQTLVNSTKADHDSVHIIHDLGPYGSDSCQHNALCYRGKPKFLSQIKTLGFPVVHFDPTQFNLNPVNPMFVSFVEREYLAQVDVLVTVGKGAYQQGIVERFLHKNGNNKLHRICSLKGVTY